jgi:hypothetical protein
MSSANSSSHAILYATHSLFLSAVSTAVNDPFGFYPMAEDLAPAMGTRRSKRMDGALKAIKHMRLAGQFDLKGFLIIITTDFA